MSRCTCSEDAQITCIVHPTELSLKKRIAELKAENKALIDANVEVANINAGLLVEVEALREALETISRLEPYDGNRHVYHSAGKVARKALAL